MANVILTNSGSVAAPEPDPLPQGGPPMAETYTYPRWYFSKDEPGGRIFATAEELEAAGGQRVWKLTPDAAADAAAKAATPESTATDEGHTPPRSRR